MLLAEVNLLWWWLSPAALLLFLAACAGHAFLHFSWLNYLYGHPFPRWFLKLLRKLNFPLVLAGIPFFWLVFGLGFAVRDAEGWGLLLAGYVILCWLASGVLAASSLYLRLRPQPQSLLSNHSRIIDMARELGHRPVGQGRRAHLARLPFNQLFEVEFAEKTLVLPTLPREWDGLTILHLSDLHFRGVPARIFFETVLDRCQQWRPDLVALTGDVVDTETHHEWIEPVLGRLRWQCHGFAILGNHDSWYEVEATRAGLRQVGYRVLGNSWERVDIRGREMIVIGHEGPWFTPAPDLSGCPEGFRLCLSHTPDNIAWARRHQIDLMLSGHVHGGQIRFPLIGSLVVPSRYFRRYDCGTFHEPPTLLHVSRGLAGQHPLRINCRPEVTLLRLVREAITPAKGSES